MKAFIAFAVVAVSTPLVAAVSDETPAAKSPNRMICRHVNVRTSETRMGGRRICRTAAQWRASRDDPGLGVSPLVEGAISPEDGFTPVADSRNRNAPHTGPN